MSVTFTFENCHPDYEINMANANARLFLENFGVDYEEDLCGEFSVENLKKILIVIEMALITKNLLPFTRERTEEGNFIYFGIGEDYVKNRLYDFRGLIQLALKLNKKVFYA